MDGQTLYPTRTRRRLAGQIAAGLVRWHYFMQPEAWTQDTAEQVTARVAELEAAGLATVPDADPGEWSLVELTDDGRAWLAAGGGRT